MLKNEGIENDTDVVVNENLASCAPVIPTSSSNLISADEKFNVNDDKNSNDHNDENDEQKIDDDFNVD